MLAVLQYTNSPINVVVRFLQIMTLTETTLSETDFTIDTIIQIKTMFLLP